MSQKAEHPHPARSAKRSSQSAKRSPEDLRNWEQVNQRLANLGEAQRQIRSLQDQYGQKVAVLKQQWLEASHPLVREKEKIECQIERFYWAHRDEVLACGRRSVDLVFGRIGSRRSCRMVVRDTAAAIAWLRDNGFNRYLRTRTVLDRKALRSVLVGACGASAEDVSKFDCCPAIRLREADEFWYEVDDSLLDRSPLPGARLQPCSVDSADGSEPDLRGSDSRGGDPRDGDESGRQPVLELCASAATHGRS